MSEENEKKDNKPFCGLGKPPKGRKRGNMLECLERKQVKFYGRNKIDPKLIEHSLRLQKTLKEKNDVIIVVSKLRGKLKNIIRKIQGEKDEEKKNKLKVMGREVRDQLLEQEKLFDSILKKEKKAEKRKKKEDVIEKSSKEKAKKLEKKVNKLEEEMDETIKKMKKEKNMDTKLLELKLKKIEDELKKTKEEAKKKVQIVKDKVELKAKKKAHLEAKKEAKKKVNKLEKEMDETIKKMKDEKHLDTKPLELKLKKIDDELKKTKVETKKKVQIAEDEFAKKEKEIADAIKEGIRKKKEKEAKKARKKERPTNVSHYLDDTFGDDAEKVRDILIKIMSCMLESKNYITTFLDLGGTGPKGEFVERKLEQFERNIIKYLPFFSELAGVDITEGEMHDGSEGSDGMHDGSYGMDNGSYGEEKGNILLNMQGTDIIAPDMMAKELEYDEELEYEKGLKSFLELLKNDVQSIARAVMEDKDSQKYIKQTMDDFEEIQDIQSNKFLGDTKENDVVHVEITWNDEIYLFLYKWDKNLNDVVEIVQEENEENEIDI